MGKAAGLARPYDGSSMHIIGIDLSGPRNVADTCVTVFQVQGAALSFKQALDAAADDAIYQLAAGLGKLDNLTVGIDAPLSYNPGGGDRPSDAALRRLVRQKGRAGIMPPTLIRMVYLTLRGMAVARMLESLRPQLVLRLVEVHPGAAMLLRDAPSADVAAFKVDGGARIRLLDWLASMGLQDIPRSGAPSDHFVAACAASLAAWQWAIGRPAWRAPAQPPAHPYDFAC
jgi:uncharacterized protein